MDAKVFLTAFGAEDYLILVLLAGNAVIDIKKHEISLPLTIAGTVIGAVLAAFMRNDFPVGLLYSSFPGIMSLVLTVLTAGSIGAGDGMTLLMLGLFYPFEDIVVIVSIALLFSAICGAVLLIRQRKGTDSFAFVPFLLAGVFVLKFLKTGG